MLKKWFGFTFGRYQASVSAGSSVILVDVFHDFS
jgi:hypothetical protein